MVTRKKSKSSEKKSEEKNCMCGSCDDPNPHLPGYILISLGLVFLPVTLGFVPQVEWMARGWPILAVLFGVTLVAKAAVCSIKSN